MTSTVTAIDRAEEYRAAGWCFPLGLPVRQKSPPPTGFTGEQGGIATPEDLAGWRAEGKTNLAGRLTRNVIGIDKDLYKDGTREAFARCEANWGELPATWSITSRADGSGIYLFRVPPAQKWEGEVCPNVEVIQYGHRYAVLPRSIHPEGRPYRMLRADGTDAGDEIPKIGDIPFLPDAWVDALMKESLDGDRGKPRQQASRPAGQRSVHQAARPSAPRLGSGGSLYDPVHRAPGSGRLRRRRWALLGGRMGRRMTTRGTPSSHC